MNICNTEKLIIPGFCQMIPGWLVSMDMEQSLVANVVHTVS